MRQAGRQVGRQANKQVDKQTDSYVCVFCMFVCMYICRKVVRKRGRAHSEYRYEEVKLLRRMAEGDKGKFNVMEREREVVCERGPRGE